MLINAIATGFYHINDDRRDLTVTWRARNLKLAMFVDVLYYMYEEDMYEHILFRR
jgi:hypothetical protein